MKKNGASRALLAPDANGWRVSLPDGASQTVKTLGEAAVAIPAGASIHLALPAQAALLERLTLPVDESRGTRRHGAASTREDTAVSHRGSDERLRCHQARRE
jgi:hypothetical protein